FVASAAVSAKKNANVETSASIGQAKTTTKNPKTAKTLKNTKEEFFIRCTGMPYTAKDNEVAEFLGGKGIKRVQLTTTQSGAGAILEYEDNQSFKAALSNNGKSMGNRHVKVMRCSSFEMADAEKATRNPSKAGGLEPTDAVTSEFVISCRGLPRGTTENQLVEFLGGKGIKRVELATKPHPIDHAIVECED
ncbi:hypothetical protein PMAYCL1PPCAC_13911, partial [Pristionchus mayeri]